MMNTRPGSDPFWNLLMYFTISAAVMACFTVLHRKDFFPEQYRKTQSAHEAQVKREDTKIEKVVPNVKTKEHNKKEENHAPVVKIKPLPAEEKSSQKISKKEELKPAKSAVKKKVTENKTEEVKPKNNEHVVKQEKKESNINDAQYILIVGAFSSELRATALMEKLKDKYPTIKIVNVNVKNKKLFQVEAAQDSDRNKIVELRNDLISNGYTDCWFYKR